MVLELGFGLKLNMPEVHLVISYGYYSYGASDMLGVYPLGIPGKCLIDASSCMGVEEAYETHPCCIPDMNVYIMCFQRSQNTPHVQLYTPIESS